MAIIELIIIVLGLVLFEVVTSVDNAIINADVLSTMRKKYRRWFLLWGILFGVFIIRGLLPWLIVWIATPGIGPWEALIASFKSDPSVIQAIEATAPLLLIAGGTYLVFLFFHWLFIEEKNYIFWGEKTIHRHGVWFFAFISIFLAVLVWICLKINPFMAFAAVVGSTAFFITHGFKENAEKQERLLKKKGSMSDISKIMYLEVIDATFSIDSVLGAFAFTLVVPLILVGSGIGALVVRHLTIKGTGKIKKYLYLKNGAMYSILVLGIIMILDSFGFHIPSWVSPLVTFVIVGFFFLKSRREMPKSFSKKANQNP